MTSHIPNFSQRFTADSGSRLGPPFKMRHLGTCPYFLCFPVKTMCPPPSTRIAASPSSKQFFWICRKHWACFLFQPREKRLTSNTALLCYWRTGRVGIWLHRRVKLSEPGVFLEYLLNFSEVTSVVEAQRSEGGEDLEASKGTAKER